MADMSHNLNNLINMVILTAIEDLEQDVLDDEGTLAWIDAGNIEVDTIHTIIDNMPVKNGKLNAKPAMRHIMERL